MGEYFVTRSININADSAKAAAKMALWSEMYQRGYDNAAISFAYIPDFKSEKERLDFNRGLKDGYAKIEFKIQRDKNSIATVFNVKRETGKSIVNPIYDKEQEIDLSKD